MENDSYSWLEYSTLVPLPFKILFLITLGIYLWFLVVKINYKYFNLNTLQLLSLSYSKHSYSQLDGLGQSDGELATTTSAEYKENKVLLDGIWTTFHKVFLFVFTNLVAYHIINLTPLIDIFLIGRILQLAPLLVILACLFSIFYSSNTSVGKHRTYTTVKRVLTGGINSRTMRTNDILLSDSLVSYARVINDFALYLWTLWFTTSDGEEPVAYNIYVESLALSLPTLIRVKQCWYEYKITGSKTHLLNLAKYLTTLGPIYINILVRHTLKQSSLKELKNSEEDGLLVAKLASLNSWWYILATVNATYSFIWDVKMDWGLSLFDISNKKSITNRSSLVESTLRPKSQLIGPAAKYYIIILIDFGLRFLWILKFFQQTGVGESSEDYVFAKVGGFLYGGNAFQLGYTILECLEIFRRWLWCFLKLESDWFKLQAQGIELTEVKEN